MGVKISPEGRRTYDCTELIKAIDRYIAKADEDLKDQMEDAGYADAEESVSGVSELEDAIAVTLTDQTGEIIDELETAGDWTKAKKVISSYFANDTATRDTLEEIFQEYYETVVPSLANSYIKETAGDMVVTDIRKRTSAWMEEWSGQLADLMQLSSEQQMGNLVQSAIDKGESVADLTRKLMEEGIRNEEYKARRAAVTEMLRSHSVAQQEAMTQSPVVNRKKWRHSGSYKSAPRPNHVAMDGKIVPKNEPFELIGKDGVTYYPMYPRDSSLPPGESVNCGCIAQPVVDDDVLGMSLEERQKLQQEIIDNDDGEWEKELDARNKARAGIQIDEQEGSKPKYDYKQSVIDRKQIASKEYQNKFDNLGENKKVTRSIRAKAKEMLRHRSGSNYEDLAYIDTKTGKSYINKSYDVSARARPNRAMNKVLKEADDYTIVGIHNHPNSSTPSLGDIRAAVARKYKYGLVVGHNGTIFKYTINGTVNEVNADIYLAKANALFYNGDIEEFEKTLEVLSKNGVDLEVY